MRFYQVLTLWTCFPCMFDMSTMLKLVLDIWGQLRTFFEIIAHLCLLLAIDGLIATMESPHFKTTLASLNHF